MGNRLLDTPVEGQVGPPVPVQHQYAKEQPRDVLAIDLSQCDDPFTRLGLASTTKITGLYIHGNPSTTHHHHTSPTGGTSTATKRRRRGSNRREHRQKSWNVSFMAQFLDRLITSSEYQPFLQGLVRLSLCGITEEDIPVATLCRLVQNTPKLKELVLDNLIIVGTLPSDHNHSLQEKAAWPSLTSLSMSCCGSAEETLLQWLLQNCGHSSLHSLRLCQMLLSKSRDNKALGLPSTLKKLHLEKIPGVHHSSLLHSLFDDSNTEIQWQLQELKLQVPLPLEYATKLCQNMNMNHLETLSLVVDNALLSCPLNDVSSLVASILLLTGLKQLSLGFGGGGGGGHSATGPHHHQWHHLGSLLAHGLQHHQSLETLEFSVTDDDMEVPMHNTSVVLEPLEAVLTTQNTVLSLFSITSPHHGHLKLSPTLSFYLCLNQAGRRNWYENDNHHHNYLTDVVHQAPKLFPDNEAHQTSMIFHFLACNPSSWAT